MSSATNQRRQGPNDSLAAAPRPIDPGAAIGHVHLRTADIDRVLGFDVIAEIRDTPGWGTTGDAPFLSAGGYHHHLGSNAWKSVGGPPQPDGVAGLHHVAIRYPTRAGLADAPRRRQAADRPPRQLADHGTREALYIEDPAGTDLEPCWGRPFDAWPRDEHGRVTMGSGELDLTDLLREPAL